MDDVFTAGPAQPTLDLFDAPKSWQPDLAEIRAELLAIVTAAKHSPDSCPWDARTLRYHRTVFPQMTRWLPDDEASQLRQAFDEAIAAY